MMKDKKVKFDDNTQFYYRKYTTLYDSNGMPIITVGKWIISEGELSVGSVSKPNEVVEYKYFNIKSGWFK